MKRVSRILFFVLTCLAFLFDLALGSLVLALAYTS
jgi:hypothetical protein